MAYKSVNDSSLTAVANKIREKGNTQSQLSFPDGFITAIQNIPSSASGNYYKVVHGEIRYTSSSNRTFSVTVSGFTPVGALLIAIGSQTTTHVQSLSTSTDGTDNYGLSTYGAAKITSAGLSISGTTVSAANPQAGSTNLRISGYYKYVIWGK